MSEKGKRTETRGYKKCLPAMLKALKKGMRVEELRDTEHCGHDNLYSLIGIFHKAELIFEKSGKWYYTWEAEKEDLKKKYQKLSKKDVEINLLHSKDLVRHAVKKDGSDINLDIYSLVYGDRFNLFRQHLLTSYPNILQTLKRAEEQDVEMEKVFLNLYGEIKRIASDWGYEVNDHYQLLQELHKRELTFGADISDLEKVLTSYQAETVGQWDPSKNEWIPDYVTRYPRTYKKGWCTGFEMCLIEDMRSQGMDPTIYGSEDYNPKDFIDGCKASKEIKRLHGDFVKSYQEANNKYEQLADELKPIIRKITIGTEPLRGDCDECPKVLIEGEL